MNSTLILMSLVNHGDNWLWLRKDSEKFKKGYIFFDVRKIQFLTPAQFILSHPLDYETLAFCLILFILSLG